MWTTIESAGKWILSKLSFKTVGTLLLIVLIGIGAWYLYNFVYQRGVNSQAQIIATLKLNLTKAQTDTATAQKALTDYQSAVQTQRDQQVQAQQQLDAQNKAINDTLSQQLEDLKGQLAQATKVKNDLSKYISKANDAGCIIPVGFMQLYNQSIQTPSGPQYLSALPSGSVAYAPSGLSLTDVAGVFLDNNAAAIQNRQLVLAWQAWYNSVKATLDKIKASLPAGTFPEAPIKPTVTIKDVSVEPAPVVPAAASSK